MKKLILIALLALASISFASDKVTVMGKYTDSSGENYVDFSVNDFTPSKVIDFSFHLAEPDQKYHRGSHLELSFEQYNDIFESERDSKQTIRDSAGDDCVVTVTNNGNVRTVQLYIEAKNDNILLAKKTFTMTIIDGEIVEISHQVRRKKHVLIFVTVPGTFDYLDKTVVVNRDRKGLGVYADNPRWPIGTITSYENILNELSDYGTSDTYID